MADNHSEGMNSVDTSTELGRLTMNILPHIFNLYNCTPTALDYEVYAPNATFEDPLMQAHGVAQIKSAFYAMPKVFQQGVVLKYTVEEDERTPTSGEIRIPNLQQYKLLQLGPFGYFITVKSLIKLTIEGGKVTRHEDLWNESPLWNRHTVKFPLVGRMAETIRKGNMLVTHALMGFGKDHRPTPKGSSVRLKVA
jgi:hypothetical protein